MTLLKSIVVSLVLANGAYLLWARGIAKAPEEPVRAAPAGLKLASESGQASHAASTAADGLIAATAGGPGTAGGRTPGGAVPTDAAEGAGQGLLTDVKRCITVGPFRDVSDAARAASTLRGGGYDPRQRVADGDVWEGIWVYLPLPSGRGAADPVLAKLKAGGIEDALEMPGPKEGSVISLGLYGESKRAQARVAQAQALGFNPGIADRKRSGDVYWIDIDLKPTDRLLNPADLQAGSGRIVRLEVKGCPSGLSP